MYISYSCKFLDNLLCSHRLLIYFCLLFKKIFLFIDLRKRNIDLLFHLLTHPLVDAYMCPEQDSNPQPWHMGVREVMF